MSRLLSYEVEGAVAEYGAKLRAHRVAFTRYSDAVMGTDTELARALGEQRSAAKREADEAGEKLRTLLEADA